jgi:3D (Asp-Asp-Asp) domain-containing protein
MLRPAAIVLAMVWVFVLVPAMSSFFGRSRDAGDIAQAHPTASAQPRTIEPATDQPGPQVMLRSDAPTADQPVIPIEFVPEPAPAATGRAESPQRETVSALPQTRTIRMLVTAYCPCAKCCGKYADGITASGKPVTANGGFFVAADPKVLPMHTKLSVPGYFQAAPVPVYDTGGKIKGNRLDVFFPTHAEAKAWGARWLDVVVYE